MFNFGKKKNQTATIKELAKQQKSLEENLNKALEELSVLKVKQKEAITKVGLVRFNPFREIGGNQSFSVAFLDSEDSGIVITSHYGRDMQRVYAKQVLKGKSEHSLSVEEEDAIKKAKKKT